MKQIPLWNRKSILSLSTALGISRGTVHKLIQDEKVIKPHSSAVHPTLTEANQLHRIEFCLAQNDPDLPGLFQSFFDRVHVDEKWFHVDESNCKFYLADGERPPTRTTRHKSHIPKVMFLCAVARPRWDPHLKQYWDGKIGMWPFAVQRAAARSSRNRPKGTMEWKPLSVTKQVYRDYMINKVLPAIVEKWPVASRNSPILIQHDNAPSHISNDDPAFAAAVE